MRAGRVLRAVLQHESSHMIADRKHHLRVYRRSMVGTDMVDWLVQRFPSLVRSRGQAVGAWQALLEEGVLVHGVLSAPTGVRRRGRGVRRISYCNKITRKARFNR